MVRHDRYQIQRVPELIGTSGSMLLHFYSDVAYNMTGFNITFSVNACPSERYDQTCSGNGSCDESTGECRCDEDFKGPACSIPACPNNCASLDNVPHGVCDKRKKRCDCFSGWTGESCSQAVSNGYWSVLTRDDPSAEVPVARTSHASMIDEFGQMWVIGGETFDHQPRQMVLKVDIDNLDELPTATANWQEVKAKSNKGPSFRYGHSAVIHERKIYMYGGTMRSGHTSKELWALDLDLLSWDRVETESGQCMINEDHKLCGPIHSMGHTATVVAHRMIVIFGHSPKYGYLDTVQEYHLGSNEWSIVPTSGFPVRGGFGHSSVWDEITNKIYVYGGFVSNLAPSAVITNELFSFDPILKTWTRHSFSDSYRYLHSAVASHGLMIVFGGNTHNDTSFSHGAKCFSADLLVYDIVCDKWHSAQDVIPKNLDVDLARYGHTAVLKNDTMLVHGGFHGVLKNDLIAYHPGDCNMFKNRAACLKSKVGVKCVWDTKRDQCLRHPADRLKSGVETCLNHEAPDNSTSVCQSLDTCTACVSTTSDCVWCHDHCTWSPACDEKEKRTYKRTVDCREAGLGTTPKEWCGALHSCHSCSPKPGCSWESAKVSKCRETRKKTTNVNHTEESGNACPASCSERTNCMNCTHGLCMWCKNLHMCIDRNAYLASFPYGQCMDWTTEKDDCPVPSKNETLPDDICVGYRTCKSCRSNPSCGWCDDGSLTGLGTCMVGGAASPLKRVNQGGHGHFAWVPDDQCPQSDGKSWHFTTCPDCECNGHSSCTVEKSTCDKPCDEFTGGEHCEKCTKGYFGDAVNGGSCQACQCNNQASACNHETGKCHCTTKGIIGDHCETCDKVNHYFGDPVKDSCFYHLTIDYQFTFNLSKSDDRHFTAINFKNDPTKSDVDVDFSITCSVPARMNLTFRHAPLENRKQISEEQLYTDVNCSTFKERFAKEDFSFGDASNTTFYVYVYDFEPPLWIVISFSQHPKLDLLQFFITFSTCFLALLLVAAVLWKIKQRYDRYRRRQRLFVEMEQMASRPFGSVLVELEHIPPDAKSSSSLTGNSASAPSLTTSTNLNPVSPSGEHPSGGSNPGTGDQSGGGGGGGQVRKRKRKSYRPSPIALEPCEDNRAAVLSLVVRLPTGGQPYAPPGYTGIAVASALVTLGNPRKTSTDVSSQKSMEDPKRKGRKSHHAHPSDI
eukprot:TCALIF_13053-PA protein Name:"Similar to tag-53 Putative protein tag-53 (Caenorhabditis elegans)" AED:0.08 eAED:0.08 QI:208/1/1/1/0.92/1/14/654/1185